MGLGIYIYIWLEAPLIPVSSEYQHVHAITTQEHSRHSPLPVDVLNLRQGQVLVKLVFLSITIRHVGAQTVSDESSASSSASDPTRRLEDETDSLFRFLGTAVLLAELPAASVAGPDASAAPRPAPRPRPRA